MQVDCFQRCMVRIGTVQSVGEVSTQFKPPQCVPYNVGNNQLAFYYLYLYSKLSVLY